MALRDSVAPRSLAAPLRGAGIRLPAFPAGLAAFAFVNFLVFNFLVETLPSWPDRPARRPHVLHLRVREYGWDSWASMLRASDHLRTPEAGAVYEAIFFDEGMKFQYPPTSLLFVDAVRAVVEGATRFHPKHVLNVVSLVAGLLTAALAALLFVRGVAEHRPAGADRPARLEFAVLAAVALAMALTFYPLARAVAAGQIQAWLNALAALALWLVLRGRDGLAGTAAGLLVLVKPHYGVLLLWSLLRRRWTFAVALGGTCAALGLVSLAVYGVENHLDYLAVLSHMGRHGEAYYPNQSVNGLLNRALGNGDALRFDQHAFPPFHPVVFAGTLLTSAALLAAALWRPRGVRGPWDRVIDLATVLLAVTIASPIAWEHHYGVLVPVLAVAVPALRCWPVFGGATLGLIAVAYVLSANLFYGLTTWTAGTPLGFLQSHLFFAGVFLLVCLWRLRARPGPMEPWSDAGLRRSA